MSSPTLGQRFDPRRNSLSVLRLSLAGLVALVHAQAIGWGDQPVFGEVQVGDLAVDAFFVISGFLVTRSAVRLPTLRRFVWHRALRILPGFWVCLLVVGFLAAPLIAWLQGRSAGTVLSGPDSSFGFVARNAALQVRQWRIADLVVGHETAMDGSLWTLYYEALCYAVVGGLVAVGVIRHRRVRVSKAPRHGRVVRADALLRGVAHAVQDVAGRHLVLGVTAIVWLDHTLGVLGVVRIGPELLSRFVLLFLLGALGHLYAHRIRFPVVLILAAVGVLIVSVVLFREYRPLGGPAFAYLFLWAVVALPLRWEPPVDLSYGTYVYHWPVAGVLAEAGLPALGRVPFTVVLLAGTGLVAYASWRWVEAPALRQKNAAWIDRLPPRIRKRPVSVPPTSVPAERVADAAPRREPTRVGKTSW